jgi:hypothetical protein
MISGVVGKPDLEAKRDQVLKNKNYSAIVTTWPGRYESNTPVQEIGDEEIGDGFKFRNKNVNPTLI